MKRTLAALVLVASASVAHAQAKPDFTGTWELNVAKSDFGQMPAPSKITMTVTQSATALKFTQTIEGGPMGAQSVSQDMALDGQPKTTNAADGQPVTNSAKVDSGMVIITTKANRQGMDVTQASHWTLAPDGKSMTVQQEIGTPMGALSMKIVFDKK